MTLGLQRQSKPQIRIERAFMEFVKHNSSHIRQFRIIQNHAGENAFRDHFKAGFGPDPAFEPHP